MAGAAAGGGARPVPACWRRCFSRHGLAAVRHLAGRFQLPWGAGGLRTAAHARRAAAEPARHGGGERRFGVQHRHQLRCQHQLAGLQRRSHDELPDADACAGGAELSVRRHRHRGGFRIDSRFHRPHIVDTRRDAAGVQRGRCARSAHCRCHGACGNSRQLLGRHHAGHGLCAAAAVAGVCRVPGQPGRHPELRAVSRGHHTRHHQLSAAQERRRWPAAQRRKERARA